MSSRNSSSLEIKHNSKQSLNDITQYTNSLQNEKLQTYFLRKLIVISQNISQHLNSVSLTLASNMGFLGEAGVQILLGVLMECAQIKKKSFLNYIMIRTLLKKGAILGFSTQSCLNYGWCNFTTDCSIPKSSATIIFNPKKFTIMAFHSNFHY